MILEYTFYLNQEKDSDSRLLGMMRGYQFGDKLERVYRGTIDWSQEERVPDVCEKLFAMFNTDERPSDYRNRSMSVGDVVVLYNPSLESRRAFAVGVFGFIAVDGLEDLE